MMEFVSRGVVLALFVLGANLGWGQMTKADSVWVQWQDESVADSIRAEKLVDYLYHSGLIRTNVDSSLSLLEGLKDFAEKKDYPYARGLALRVQMMVLAKSGSYLQALDIAPEALDITERTSPKDVDQVLMNWGICYRRIGKSSRAIELYSQVLNNAEKRGDDRARAMVLINIASLHMDADNNDQAREHLLKSLELAQKVGDVRVRGIAEGNLGLIYKRQGNFEEALIYLNKELNSCIERGDSLSMSLVYVNLGSAYEKKGDAQLAEESFLKGIQLASSLNDNHGLAGAYMSYASFLQNNGRCTEAIDKGRKGLTLAERQGSTHWVQQIAEVLYKCYKQQGNLDQALKMHEIHAAAADSMARQELEDKLDKQEYKYTYEKKFVKDSVRIAEAQKVKDAEHASISAKKDAEIEKHTLQQYYLVAGISALVLFIIYGYTRYRIISRQKRIIEEQKILVEEAASTKLENERLKRQQMSQDLTNASLEISRKQEWIEELRTKLKERREEEDEGVQIRTVLAEMSHQMQLEQKHELLYSQVSEVNSEFYSKLGMRHGGLTNNELELCALLRLNLTSKDIGKMKNIADESVRMARKRLRKKLDLQKGEDLVEYLRKI